MRVSDADLSVGRRLFSQPIGTQGKPPTMAARASQNPMIFPYSTSRTMVPRAMASPISVLLGLGLLVGSESLIETGDIGAIATGTIGAGWSGVGVVMEISLGIKTAFSLYS
jgi:hypothetical protein